MSYVMKWRYVVGVFLLLCICVLPASAADGFGVEKIESEYLILPLNIEDLIEPYAYISSYVTQGQIRYFDHYVSPGSTKISIQLSWALTQNHNSLKLIVVNPDSVPVVECFDTFENSTPNGTIPVEICSESGLISGNWIIAIVGTDVSGLQYFNIIINSN